MNALDTNKTKECAEESLGQRRLAERRKELERLLALTVPMERLIAGLPPELSERCGVCSEWVQFSDLTRAEVQLALSVMRAGRWKKKVCHANPGKIDYEGVVDGVQVVIFYAEPPTSCRIVEEEVVIPEQRKMERRLVCA